MNRLECVKIVTVLCVLLILVSGSGAVELPRPLDATPSEKAGSDERFITIDFDNVDIQLFIKYISELSGKNFVVDKAVQGNVTILSPSKISESEAYRVFESVLEVHGFTTVEAGSVIKILPSARARSQNLDMLKMGASADPEDKVVTQLVPLKYSSPDDIKKVLTPLVSQTSVLIAHAASGMLIITETHSNIQKLLSIIEVLDVESREAEVAVVPLQNASSAALAKLLSTIFQDTTRRQTQKGESQLVTGDVKIVPYERVNALVVLSSSTEMGKVKGLIQMLDTEIERAEGNIHVYYLQNATAVELAKVLSSFSQQQPTAEEQQEKGKAAAISKNVNVMADEETNALIITATKDEYAVIEDVIKQLDIPRRMVYLEALIMEVDVDKSFEVGVEWALGGTFADDTGAVAGGFSGSEGFGFLEGINSDNPSLASGFTFGLLKSGIQIGGITFPNIGAVLNAYKTDSSINIISTPQILTTDNKKAEISVGENIPYITSRNTTAGDQDYTQYEYKDVATKLSIVPHINQADTLRLEIETEVVRVKGSASDTPTTFKRTASTTVLLNDNDTVVIGGIIGQDMTESEWKIPLLGDIPLLGWLFKTDSNRNTKTNMFIFITPRIVRNPADLSAVTLKKQDAMGEAWSSDMEKVMDKKPNPEHANKLTHLGVMKLQQEKFMEAENLFKQALNIDPINPYALFNLGEVNERNGNNAQALDLYRKVLSEVENARLSEDGDLSEDNSRFQKVAQEGIERILKKENQGSQR